MKTENAIPNQETRTLFYCRWTSGAKEYFHTLQEAMDKASQMYKRTERMTDDNYKYWLAQRQIVGMETTVETEIFYVSA